MNCRPFALSSVVARAARVLAPWAVAFLAVACAPSRVTRLTDQVYPPKADFARVDVYAGRLTRSCQPIAWIESRRYELPDYFPKTKVPAEQARHEAAHDEQEKVKRRMVSDLEELARTLGGDAVDRVHLAEERRHGWLSDPDVPVPGAVRQGYSYRYYYIGEAVKYLDDGPDDGTSAEEPIPTVPEVPDVSVEVLPLDESNLPTAGE